MVLAETFGHSLLRQSLARLFQRDEQGLLDMAWHATLDVLTPPVRIPPPHPPCIGCCLSMFFCKRPVICCLASDCAAHT